MYVYVDKIYGVLVVIACLHITCEDSSLFQFMYMYICVCVYMCVRICIYVKVGFCAQISMYNVRWNVSISMHTCRHVYTCICIYIYIYIPCIHAG